MSQMSPADQAVIKALPGNDVCADCPQIKPDWASVSFGNLICLECSGIHRSLGVHISFVRSIAMDSWTPKQLEMMKNGGNKKQNDYLKSKGIDPKTPVKAKYESDYAQLYKERLKARVEGRLEPMTLHSPKRLIAAPPASAPANFSGGGGSGMSNDPNGMERLIGESERQYIARQTRLKEEARARMQAKFGNTGGKMDGVGSTMQGIGSNPHYNPNTGGYGSPSIGAPDKNTVMSSVSGALSSGLSLMSSAATAAASTAATAATVVKDTSKQSSLSGYTASFYGGSFWNTLKTTVGDVAMAVTQPDAPDDGLAALQRDIQSHMPSKSKYNGFGSVNPFGGNNSNQNNGSSPVFGGNATNSGFGSGSGSGGGGFQEATGLPDEDPNGMERLTSETDEQYVIRQTRLCDEAEARMATKFGGGLTSAGPLTNSSSLSMYTPKQTPLSQSSASVGGMDGGSMQEASGLPGEDRNGIERLTGETDEQYVMRQTRIRDEAKARMVAKFGDGGMSSASQSLILSSTEAATTSTTFPQTFNTSRTPATSGKSFRAIKSYPSGMSISSNRAKTPQKAPSSFVSTGMSNSANNAFRGGSIAPPRKNSHDSGDFFASFGA